MSEDKRKYNGRKSGTTKNKVQGEIVKKEFKVGSVKKRKNTYQSETMEEFLKVRPGETLKEWEKRTEKRRLVGQVKDNKISVAKNGKLEVRKEVLTGMDKELQIKVLNRFREKPYDYLKNYAYIMRWASTRYGVFKDDIEIGFIFYDQGAFTRNEFERACIRLGTVRGVFSRFLKKGYLSQYSLVSKEGLVTQFEYYQLTVEFLRMLKATYEAISKVNKMTLTIRSSAEYKKNPPPKELEEYLIQLNNEVDQVNNGQLKTHFKEE